MTSRIGRAPLRKSERPKTSWPRRSPIPNRTEPCGSVSTIRVLRPRRARAAARFTAVVVLPTPPFWLTTARTRPSLGVSVRQRLRSPAPERVERLSGVPHPAVGLGALRRLTQEQLEVFLRALHVAALEQEKGEAIVRSGELRLEVERTPVTAHGFIQPAGLREGDRHVLEDLGIIGLIAKREAIRRQGRVIITLTLQRERLAQVVQALRLELALRLATNEAAPPGHESRNRVKRRPRRARRKSGVRVVGRTSPHPKAQVAKLRARTGRSNSISALARGTPRRARASTFLRPALALGSSCERTFRGKYMPRRYSVDPNKG